MSTPIRTRLISTNLTVLLLGMTLAALLAWKSVESLYLQTQQENLLAQAEITAAALQGQPLPITLEEPYYQTTNVMPGIHSRILGEQGAVILSLPISEENTQLQAPPAENQSYISPEELLARPEIEQALKGQSATAVRRVASAENRRVLYAAAPIQTFDGNVSGLVYLATPLPAAGIPNSLLSDLVIAALAAVILALIVGTLLARRIARPIENIAHAAEVVSEGNLYYRVQTESDVRELDNLKQAFNKMTKSLQHSDQAKNAFIADVTHELRTPLTVIKGTIETLEDGALDDTAGRGPLLESMHRETDRLIRLVNDLLVLTRADAGMLNLQRLPINLGELVRGRCEHFTPLANRSQVHFEVIIPKSIDPLMVTGDDDRLAQVLDNMLDNAIRYSPPGSAISVEVCRDDRTCHFLVHDCGPGILPDHLPYIFERFYRADASRNRQTGGVGLGLAIARALILAHDGSIFAESTPGEGTTLHFTLPGT
ncbi:MAG: HAMP domain-containing protein [Anaerolineales bacterium]|nr:HAMP domain-containing protein [Anaerolineales bacterium]